jgi:hypothetical protein
MWWAEGVGEDGDEGNPLKMKSASGLMQVITDRQLEAFLSCGPRHTEADVVSSSNHPVFHLPKFALHIKCINS